MLCTSIGITSIRPVVVVLDFGIRHIVVRNCIVLDNKQHTLADKRLQLLDHYLPEWTVHLVLEHHLRPKLQNFPLDLPHPKLF